EGEGGTRGSGRTTCSPVHTDSSPAASAAFAMPIISSRLAARPKFIPKKPIFIRHQLRNEVLSQPQGITREFAVAGVQGAPGLPAKPTPRTDHEDAHVCGNRAPGTVPGSTERLAPQAVLASV